MSDRINEPKRHITLSGNNNPIMGVALSPDETILACVQCRNTEGAILFYDPRTGKEVRASIVFRQIYSICWSLDSSRLYVTEYGRLWCIQRSGQILELCAKPLYTAKEHKAIQVCCLQDGYVVFATNGGYLRILNKEHKQVFEKKGLGEIFDIRPTPNLFSFMLIYRENCELFVRTSTKDKFSYTSRELDSCKTIINHCGQTPNGTLVYLLARAIVLDPPNDVRRIIQMKMKCQALLIVDDETIIISTKDPNYIVIMRIPDGKILCDFSGFNSPVVGMCLFDQDRFLITTVSNHVPFENYCDGSLPVQFFDFGGPNLGRGSFIFDKLPV